MAQRCTPFAVGILLCLGGALAVSNAHRSSEGARAKAQAKVQAVMKLGVMSTAGVTRYGSKRIRAVKSRSEFYWGSAGGKQGKFGSSAFAGPTDFTSNISWAWHHPNGVFNTIPVGAPLIDDQMSIYLASDDAIRKFDTLGSLLWTYGPRGQLAAAPTLSQASNDTLRVGAGAESNLLRIGDGVEVRFGKGYHAKGKEYYRAGDVGEVIKIVASDRGEPRAVIRWPRTGHASSALLSTWEEKFTRAAASKRQRAIPALYGTTISGYAFAIDLETGDEIWATKVSSEIAGVKGSLAARDGTLVLASDRCRNRYCYRYRNESENLVPSNSVVRGLSSVDGSSIWSFTPDSPVWNFDAQFTPSGTLFFQDFQGGLYCLNITTGELIWKKEGQIGMYTQSAALFSEELNYVFSITESLYDSKWCSPYTPPGILSWCNSMQDTPGLVRGFHAVTGAKMWETTLPMPPAGASIGKLNSGEMKEHLVIGMGLSCKYAGKYMTVGKPSELWALSGRWGGRLWKRTGPTLWTSNCAGDKEGADIRRAMGTREKCQPNSWSNPVIDAAGDVYVGNHVGVLQKWGSPSSSAYDLALLSELETGAAFLDQSIAMAPGLMAITTCNSLIVMEA